jgi:predicted GNAT family acetyltransferase
MRGLQELRRESLEEGFHFIERLWEEWENGKNRFDAPGERLLGYIENASLIAVGGVNQDPSGRIGIGRIRRVYVRPAWRSQGVAQMLVEALVETARTNFSSLELRTDNPTAARLYERIGFEKRAVQNATHVLLFDQ